MFGLKMISMFSFLLNTVRHPKMLIYCFRFFFLIFPCFYFALHQSLMFPDQSRFGRCFTVRHRATCWLMDEKVSQYWNWPLKTDQSFHSSASSSFTSSLCLPLCKRLLLSSIELTWPAFAFALDLCVISSVRWRGGKFNWTWPSHPI